MSVISTTLEFPIPPDLVMIAAQDIIDQRGWRVQSMSSSELVFQERDWDMMKGSSPKIVATFINKGDHTQVQIIGKFLGYGPIAKKILAGFVGQFVNSLSLRAQTNSVSINPTVQIGEGQGGGSSPVVDKYELLRKAKQLLDDGVLTEEEFLVEKSQILNGED